MMNTRLSMKSTPNRKDRTDDLKTRSRKSEVNYNAKMKPVENWTMSYPPEKMKDGTDVSKRIEINRSKQIAADKRKAKIQESNRRNKRNTS